MNQGIYVFLPHVNRGRCLSAMRVCSVILDQPVYYKSFVGEICNNFKEHVEISGYGNIVKIFKNLKRFQKLLGKFAANIGWILVRFVKFLIIEVIKFIKVLRA